MELKSIDVTKLAAAKNEALMEMADQFKISYNAEQLNRAELIAALKALVSENVATQKNVKVIFHNSPDSPKEVLVILNGKNFSYPKDVEVNVPAEVLSVINDAYEWRVETDEMGRRTQRRYQSQTYSVVQN